MAETTINTVAEFRDYYVQKMSARVETGEVSPEGFDHAVRLFDAIDFYVTGTLDEGKDVEYGMLAFSFTVETMWENIATLKQRERTEEPG